MKLEKILEEYVKKHIPLSSAMGIKVKLATPEKIILSAPIANNINHKKTVFGGSLHSVATLSCWSLLFVNLVAIPGEQVEIVIASSEIEYLTPITHDFEAECHIPNEVEWERFVKIFNKKGRARLNLESKIFIA